MSDQARVSAEIDAFEMRALDDSQLHRAAVTVCSSMTRAGHPTAEIRTVLEALGLLIPSRDAGSAT